MIPVLFEIGPFKIYSFGLLLGIGFLLGSYILSLELKRKKLDPEIASTIRAQLSDREIEVLKLIANGKDNAVIAAELHISPKTVKNHISNILMKLQIDNRIQAAVYAVRSGLV